MKKLGIALLALVLVLSVVACGGKQHEAEKKVEAQKADKTQLVYWSMWNPTEPQAKEIKKALDAYMAKNPSVEIQAEFKGREIKKILTVALDNGQKIDFWDYDVEHVSRKWHSYALPLDDYMAKSYPTTNAKPYNEAVMASLLGMAKGFSPDGKTYAAPYQPYILTFMYNKDHFEKAGVTSVPKTWAEFDAACAKLKAAGFTPITSDDVYVEALFGYHLARLKGAAWVLDLVNGENGATWDDPAVLEAAKAWKDFANKGYIDAKLATNRHPQGQQDIGMGTATMYLNGSWLPNEIRMTTGPDFKWGQFNYPAVEGGVTGINAANFGCQSFQINKVTEKPELVFEIVASLTTGATDEAIAAATMGIPVGLDSAWPVQLAEAKAIFDKLDTVYPWAANIQANPETSTRLQPALIKLMTDKTFSAEDFVAAVKK